MEAGISKHLKEEQGREEHLKGKHLNEEHVREEHLKEKHLKEEHVRKALLADKGHGVHLLSWRAAPFTAKADNYASEILSVKITFQRGGEQHEDHYVVKLSPTNDEELFIEMSHLEFTRESAFYTEILPALTSVLSNLGLKELSAPKCHFATVVEKEKELIILEDLRRRDFRMHARQASMDVAHTELVLQELARLHASSLLLTLRHESRDGDFPGRYSKLLGKDERFKSFTQEMTSMYLENARRVLHEYGGYEKVEEWIKENKSKCADLENDLTKGLPPFEVICQGDCWNNNFLFRYDDRNVPVEVMLLDFQGCTMSSLATDLVELMYTSLDGFTRKKHLDSFLANYYSTFKGIAEAAGASVPFTLQDLREEYGKKRLLGLLRGSVFIPWMVYSEDGLQWYEGPANDEEKLEEFMEDLKSKTMDILEADPVRKRRFLSVFDDMVDEGVLS